MWSPFNYHSRERIMNLLDDLETSYFSFLEKDLKPRCVVLTGLPASWDEEKVMQKLKLLALKDVEFLGVGRMWTHFASLRNIQSNNSR